MKTAYQLVCVLTMCLSLNLVSCGGGSHGGASHGGGGHGGGGHGKAAKADSAHGATHGDDSHESHDPHDMVEVDLGEFTITQRQPASHAVLLIRFKIFGVVEREKKETFEGVLEERRQRMRDSVITIVQKAEVEQLSDPSLGWLKAELIPAINKVLRTRLLSDVVFSDFAMLQS